MLAAPAGAGAAMVSFESILGSEMTAVYVRDSSSDPAETNDLSIGWDGESQEIVIRDAGAPLTTGIGDCTSLDPAEVRCPKPTNGVEVRPGPGDDTVAFQPGLPPLTGGVARPWSVNDESGALTGSGDDRYTGAAEANNFRASDGADVIDGGAGDDQLITRSTVAEVYGGTGDDVLQSAFASTAGSGTTLLDGGAGNDQIAGLGRLLGGPGDDGLSPTLGPGDIVDGGPGDDAVSYGMHGPDPVTIDLAGGPSYAQGMPGEADSIVNVENARASQYGGDVVYGTAGPNRIEGLAGADALHGRDGDDIIDGGWLATGAAFGSDGPDLVDGGAGADAAAYSSRNLGVTVDLRRSDGQGEPGENDAFQSIEGAWDGAGNDLLIGSAGSDRFQVTAGTDRVDVRDGVADVVLCATNSGPEDVVVADAIDEVGGGCTVERPARPDPVDSDGDGVPDGVDPCPAFAGPAGSACPPGAPLSPVPVIPQLRAPAPALAPPRAASLRLRADRRRRVTVRLAAAPATETVVVTLRRQGRTLGSTKIKAIEGRVATARLRLGAALYAQLRRKRRLAANLTLRAGVRSRTHMVTLRP